MSDTIIIAILVAIPATITAYAALVNALNGKPQAVTAAAKKATDAKDTEIRELEDKNDALQSQNDQLVTVIHQLTGRQPPEGPR